MLKDSFTLTVTENLLPNKGGRISSGSCYAEFKKRILLKLRVL